MTDSAKRDPILPKPVTETEDPRRAKERTETEEPKLMKSITEAVLPKRVVERRDNDEPRFTLLNNDNVDAKSVLPSTLTVLPNLVKLLNDPFHPLGYASAHRASITCLILLLDLLHVVQKTVSMRMQAAPEGNYSPASGQVCTSQSSEYSQSDPLGQPGLQQGSCNRPTGRAF